VNESKIDFVERMGRYLEADGVPRIGGRLWGFLLLTEEPQSLDDMARALHVSKTSVSTNARMLHQWGMIERVTKAGDRKDYYQAAPDQVRMLHVWIERLTEMNRLLALGLASSPDMPDVTRRFEGMRRFNSDILELLHSLESNREAS